MSVFVYLQRCASVIAHERNPGRRRQLIHQQGQQLLRHCLSRHGSLSMDAWFFAAGDNGKPLLDPAQHAVDPLSFNLSHSKQWFAVAVAVNSHVVLGVDIEQPKLGRDLLGIAAQCFAAEELAQLHAAPRHQREALFYSLWVLKEAHVKATGRGLATPLSQCRFMLPLPVPPSDHWQPVAGNDLHAELVWQHWLMMPQTGVYLALSRGGQSVTEEAPQFIELPLR